ncbi:MAG: hypothetical protein AAE983_04245 [Thermoplasmataceae archaeon]|jgi:hypothetical protein
MNTERLEYGSMGAGLIVGILLLVLLGWIPFTGWIIAGFAAGLAARGSIRGFFSGLIAGVIVSAVLIAVILFVNVGDINTIFSYFGTSSLVVSIYTVVMHLENLSSVALIKAIVINGIAIPAIGGLVGGSILSRGYMVVEQEEQEQPASSPTQVAPEPAGKD